MIVATETIDAGGHRVVVREWSVADIRAHFAAQRPEGDVDTVDAFLIEGFYLQDIPRFTDLAMADLEAMGPSEINKIVVVIKRLNVDFFRTCALAVALAKAQAPSGAT